MTPKILTLAVAAMFGSAATADDIDGIQNHAVQQLFLTAPCSAVIDAIENPAPGLVGMGEMAMTFGVLMGVEVMSPGIRGDHDTILQRLSDDCSATPDIPAMDLLRGYADD